MLNHTKQLQAAGDHCSLRAAFRQSQTFLKFFTVFKTLTETFYVKDP